MADVSKCKHLLKVFNIALDKCMSCGMTSEQIEMEQRVLMSSTTKPQCEQSEHEWEIYSDKCIKCGYSFQEYRDGKERKDRYNYACECGAEKSGFDSHTHWCPRGSKK